jgi:hypothetical protein
MYFVRRKFFTFCIHTYSHTVLVLTLTLTCVCTHTYMTCRSVAHTKTSMYWVHYKCSWRSNVRLLLLGLPVPSFILPITPFMLCDDLDPGTRRGPFGLLVIPGVLLEVDGGCVVGVPMVDDEGEVGVVCGALVGLFAPTNDFSMLLIRLDIAPRTLSIRDICDRIAEDAAVLPPPPPLPLPTPPPFFFSVKLGGCTFSSGILYFSAATCDKYLRKREGEKEGSKCTTTFNDF